MAGDDTAMHGEGATGASGAYEGAVDHYTSPDRRDAVKRHWEEPASHRLLDEVVARVAGEAELRVVDVGCGTGDGLALLRSAPEWRRRSAAGARLRYVGLDLDERLLTVARRRHADYPEVTFVRGDVRTDVPRPDAHAVLSSGVPYSHLTPRELEHALTNLLRAAAPRPHPVALVVDVLGRYSVEWTSRWDRRRWDYRMSFFRSQQPPVHTEMTCYSGAELRELLQRAAEAAGCPLAGVTCADRSILVGRHSSTGEYTPGLPRFRELVNALHDPDVEADLDALDFAVDLPPAPPSIHEFFAGFGGAWNELVAQARSRAARVGATERAAVLQPRLADELRRLEADRQRGLGVGHSLTAVVVTRPGG